jgi:hypothetical protein
VSITKLQTLPANRPQSRIDYSAIPGATELGIKKRIGFNTNSIPFKLFLQEIRIAYGFAIKRPKIKKETFSFVAKALRHPLILSYV